MKKEVPSRRLMELVDTLQRCGDLPESDMSELESLLASDEGAREYYVLSQELQTMLEADRSIRLQLASDLLPDNVFPMAGIDSARLALVDPVEEVDEISKTSSKAGFRMATSFAAMISGVVVLLWMYSRVSEFSERISKPLASADVPISFHNQVLPILAEHCFKCHGKDEEARKGDLRLDMAKYALAGDQPVIVRGQAHESEFFARISSTDPEYVMPPADEKDALSGDQVALLKAWISEGAEFDSAWSAARPTRQIDEWLALLSD